MEELDSEAAFVKKNGFVRTNLQTASYFKFSGAHCDCTQKEKNVKKPQFNCDKCYFQETTGSELEKHLNSKSQIAANGVNECRDCGEEYSEWWNLIDHRRDIHPKKRRTRINEIKR